MNRKNIKIVVQTMVLVCTTIFIFGLSTKLSFFSMFSPKYMFNLPYIVKIKTNDTY